MKNGVQKLRKKFFLIITIVILIAITPSFGIMAAKYGAPSSVNDIKYLQYKIEFSGSLIYTKVNNTTGLTKNVYVVNKSSTAFLYISVLNGTYNIIGNANGFSAKGIEMIALAANYQYPDDTVNTNLTHSHTGISKYGSIYSRLYGFFERTGYTYLKPIPVSGVSNISGPPGTIISGIIVGNLDTGIMENGNLVYLADVSSNLYGDKTSLEDTFSALSPAAQDFIGGLNNFNNLLSYANNSGSFEITSDTYITLISTNVVFQPNYIPYIFNGIFTSMIPLMFYGLFTYGTRRGWTYRHRLVFSSSFTIIASILILPLTYPFYIPF